MQALKTFLLLLLLPLSSGTSLNRTTDILLAIRTIGIERLIGQLAHSLYVILPSVALYLSCRESVSYARQTSIMFGRTY